MRPESACERPAEDKEQHGRLSDFHLLVIAGSLECFATRQQRGGQFFGTFQRSAIDRLGNAVEFAVGGIEQNHSPLREDPSVEPGKGGAQRFSWPVGLTQELRSLGVSSNFTASSARAQSLPQVAQLDGDEHRGSWW
jgi:hypothetical protein